MKIAFISANTEHLPDPVWPIGLLYLIANTDGWHRKQLWDLCFEAHPLEFLRQKVHSFKPDLIVVGIRNIQNNEYTDSSANLRYYDNLFAHLRQLSKAPIVVGGSGFSIFPERLLARFKADYGIWGEGEKTFSLLVKALERSDVNLLSKVPNLYHYSNGTVQFTQKAAAFIDLDQINSPAYDYVDPRYIEWGGIANVQTKRGCPLNCTYCTYPTIEGRTKRVLAPGLVADQMIQLAQKAAVKHIFIVDSTFNIPSSHAKAICKELIKKSYKIPWTCYINPIGFDAELADLMVQAGCVGFECGSDSGCDDILRKLNKGFDLQKIQNLSGICKSSSLKDCHTFVLGTTDENDSHVARSLDFIVELDPFCAILMLWVDDREALDDCYATKRRRFRERIKKVLLAKKDLYPRWIIPSLKVNYDARIFRILRLKGLTGPLWQYLDRS